MLTPRRKTVATAVAQRVKGLRPLPWPHRKPTRVSCKRSCARISSAQVQARRRSRTTVSRAEADAFVDGLERASAENRFFGASNFYAHVARRGA